MPKLIQNKVWILAVPNRKKLEKCTLERVKVTRESSQVHGGILNKTIHVTYGAFIKLDTKLI